jgi:hypothetical protein
MPRPVTKTVIERAIKAVIAGGIPMERIKCVRTCGGDVTVLIGETAGNQQTQNEWDSVLEK